MPRPSPSERIDLLSGNDARGCKFDPEPSSFECHDESNQSSNADNQVVASKTNGWSAVLFGQTIALALSCANAASSALENHYQIHVPTCQTGLVYFILSFHLICLFWRRCGPYETIEDAASHHRQAGENINTQQSSIECSGAPSSNSTIKIRHTFPFTNLPLHTPWHTYLLLSILDVEANYLAMLSFQHTSLSSSMLLTSLSVLSTVLLRRLIFPSATYGGKQMLGIFMCLIGGCLWLREEFYHRGGADELDGDERLDASFNPAKQSHLHVIEGDLLALSAACLYGLNDVLAEYFVKTNNDKWEYLGMLGFFGAAFSFLVQAPLLEKDRVQKLLAGEEDYPASIVGASLLLLCFTVLLCYFYMAVMSFLAVYDSTILNLSLQSCPMWAVVFTMAQQLLLEKNSDWLVLPPPMFFVSLAMVTVGVFFYESNSGNERADVDLGSDAKIKPERGDARWVSG